jgi:uncharacterized membrane protein
MTIRRFHSVYVIGKRTYPSTYMPGHWAGNDRDMTTPENVDIAHVTATMTTEGDQEAGAADNSLGRLLALSDGVFAIALTLLALDLHVPDLGRITSNAALQHALAQQKSNYLSFLISFYVVAAYWTRHRRLMRSVAVFDPGLVGRTLSLLLCVAALPFPAALLGQYGSEAISLVIYGTVNALAVITLLRLQYFVRDRHLRRPGLDLDRNEVGELIGTLVVFLLCIPAGYVAPGNGAWVLLLLPVVLRWQPLSHRLRSRRH